MSQLGEADRSQDGPRAPDGVDQLVCRDAENFLDVLSPRHPSWEGQANAWVFRGQANAVWDLRPSAMRGLNAFAGLGLGSDTEKLGWSERARHQTALLKDFRCGLDRSGLVIPARSPRVDPSELSETTSNAEPIREAFPLMALAQHHGLPTMLLDWSRRSYVAAYFAAVEAADPRQRGDAKHLAVWALRQRIDCFHSPEDPLFYDAPGGTNPNLHAQAGLFTFLVREDDETIDQHVARVGGYQLRRIIVSVGLAPRLLRLLRDERITGATLFPGADGVVRAMRERALWDRRA